MAARVITKTEVERLLPVESCIEVMAEVLAALTRGELVNPLRTILRPEGTATYLALMPSYRPRPALYGLKAVCVAPGNGARGLDTHQGFIALFDGETGQTRALVSAGAVTAARTAAVSALATRLLARRDATTLAIIGAGTQARAHLAAMRAVLPLERVVAWNRTPSRLRELDGVEEAASVREALRDADVVVTATAASEPVVRHEWLKEGVHVNAVGSAKRTTRELDSATMAAAAIYVERRESVLNESGDYLLAAAEGAVSPERIRGELGELILGTVPGRQSEAELTVYKSLGLAVEDLAAAEHVLALAEASQAGTVVEL